VAELLAEASAAASATTTTTGGGGSSSGSVLSPRDPACLHFLLPVLAAVCAASSPPAAAAQVEAASQVLCAFASAAEAVGFEDPSCDAASALAAASLLPLRPQALGLCLAVCCSGRATAKAERAAAEALCLLAGPGAPPLGPAEWGPLLGDQGLLGPQAAQLAVLGALHRLASDEPGRLAGNPLLESRLWLCCHLPDGPAKDLATGAWAARGLPLGSTSFAPPLLSLLGHKAKPVRLAAAKALAGGLLEHPSAAPVTVGRLTDLFAAHPAPPVEVLSGAAAMAAQGLTVEEYLNAALPSEQDGGADGWGAASGGGALDDGEREDESEAGCRKRVREAVGEALAACGQACALGPVEADGLLGVALRFVVEHGLCDPHAAVRAAMLAAGSAVVEGYGSAGQAGPLLVLLEHAMDEALAKSDQALAKASSGKKGKASSQHEGLSEAGRARVAELDDLRREGTVALLGSVAKHLDKTDPKVRPPSRRGGGSGSKRATPLPPPRAPGSS
jgi:hypothetical protein